MHVKAGFNDAYWLTRTLVETLAQPGGPLSSPDSPIVDFGCGTGNLGEKLFNAGYKNIVGVDGSTEMMRQAKEKGCYRETY